MPLPCGDSQVELSLKESSVVVTRRLQNSLLPRKVSFGKVFLFLLSLLVTQFLSLSTLAGQDFLASEDGQAFVSKLAEDDPALQSRGVPVDLGKYAWKSWAAPLVAAVTATAAGIYASHSKEGESILVPSLSQRSSLTTSFSQFFQLKTSSIPMKEESSSPKWPKMRA